ncbi:MAG: AlpA family phage regulatory protein [Thermoplasmata archaeon]|nr:AlpA family phage regulatory protein [Thermoplasmata archaeon]
MSAATRRLIRFWTLREMVPHDRSWFFRMEAENRFPKRIWIGKNSVAWDQDEVLGWIADQDKRRNAA